MIQIQLFLVALTLIVVMSTMFKPKQPKTGGKGKKSEDDRTPIMSMSVRPTASHPAIPLRNPVRTWIVNVPLTPFRAPLKRLAPVAVPYSIYHKSVTPVRDQGDCGACWAFVVCDTLSDRSYIRSRDKFRVTLSPQHLINCFDPEGCDGGSPEECVIWMANSKFRLATAKQIPYKVSDGSKSGISQCESIGLIGIGDNSVVSLVEFIPEDGYDKDTLQANIINMKRELATGGPIYTAITVYDDLFGFTGNGVYERDPKSHVIGGHAVEIVGYSGDNYWICKNSWGTKWPRNSKSPGIFKVKMGVNMCGIESRCGTAEPIVYGRKA